MKSLTKVVLASLLAVAPVVAAVGTASANSELVPASRLAIPYWDINGGRSTLILVTNVSKTVDLGASATPTAGVHIEFYDKTCSRTNKTFKLSKGDIDQLDLKSGAFNLTGDPDLPSGLGFADIDVRATPAGTTSASIERNVLMGTVIIADSGGDFAVAYPAASILGSAASGLAGGTIVTRNAQGNAAVWTGAYEPLPARVFVPMFFAEGGPASTTSTLAIASPADGNWDSSGFGEAPGQDLNADANGNLIDATVQFWDGCENPESPGIEGHMIFGSLKDLFGNRADQTLFPWKTSTACTGQFPSIDEFSGAFIGWIDIPNASVPDFGLAGLPTAAGEGVDAERGMVGVLIQNSGKQGDATRLWGDPEYNTLGTNPRDGFYSLVDFLNFADIAP